MERVTIQDSESGEQGETPPMSDAYYKARKQFVLFSALSLGWQYVGIQIANTDAGSTTLKLPNADVLIAILHPEVIPFVVFLIMLYFGFRWLNEWFQCPSSRRARRATQWDFGVSALLGISAFATYLMQSISDIQIVDVFSPAKITAAIAATGMAFNFVDLLDYKHPKYRPSQSTLMFVVGGAMLATAFAEASFGELKYFILIGFVSGLVWAIRVSYVYWKLRKAQSSMQARS